MLNHISEQDFSPKTHRPRRLARERYPEAHIPSHGADDRQRRPTAPNLPAFLRLNHGRRGHPAHQSHAFRQGEIRTGAPFFLPEICSSWPANLPLTEHGQTSDLASALWRCPAARLPSSRLLRSQPCYTRSVRSPHPAVRACARSPR